MDHLIAGERNPKVLAQLARAAARRKITELEEALDGAEFFTDAHAALLKTMLARIDWVTADIGGLSEAINNSSPRTSNSSSRPTSMLGTGSGSPPRTPSPRPAWT